MKRYISFVKYSFLLVFLMGTITLSSSASGGLQVCSISRLNVYLKPSKTSTVITQVELGRPVYLTDSYEGWNRIILEDGRKGWIEPGSVMSSVDFRKKYPYLTFDQTAYDRIAQDYDRIAGGQKQKTAVKIVYVKIDDIDIRERPDESSNVIGNDRFGQIFEVTGESGTWREIITSEGKTGWIKSSALASKNEVLNILRKKEASSKRVQSVYRLNSSTANAPVRIGPSGEQKIVTYLQPSDTLLVTCVFGDWNKIVASVNKYGWVSNQFCINDQALTKRYGGKDADSVILLWQIPDSLIAQFNEERQRLVKMQEELLLRQQESKQSIDSSRKEWETVQQQWLDHQKKEIDSLKAENRKQILEKEQRLQSEQESLKKLSDEAATKNAQALQQIQKMQQQVEEEMKKLEETRQKARALRTEEEKMDNESFFFDLVMTSMLDTRMMLVDSIKGEIEKAVQKERDELAQQKVAAQKEKELLEMRLKEETRKLENEKQLLDSRKKETEMQLTRATEEFEKQKTVRENEFRKKVELQELQVQQRMTELDKRIEAERKELETKEKARLDSLQKVSAEKAGTEAGKRPASDTSMHGIDTIGTSTAAAQVAEVQSLIARLEQERKRTREEASKEKEKLLKDQEALLAFQKSMEQDFRTKLEQWRKQEQQRFTKKHGELDSIGRIQEQQLTKREKELDNREKMLVLRAQQLEEKQKKVQQEIESMRKQLEEQIGRFEAAKKDFQQLQRAERSMLDEDFFFDDKTTTTLENSMKKTDSLRMITELQVSKDHEKLQKQEKELELIKTDSAGKIALERSTIQKERSAAELEKKELQEKLKEAERKLMEERSLRESEFAGQLQQEKFQAQARLEREVQDAVLRQIEVDRKQSRVEDSLVKVQNRAARLALDKEKSLLKKEWARIDSARRQLHLPKAGPDYRLTAGIEPGGTEESTETAQRRKPSRDFDEVTRVMSDKVALAMKAYSSMLKKHPGLSGKIVMSFQIATSGDVSDLQIIENSVNNSELETLVLSEFSTCKFRKIDPSDKPYTVTYPLLFFPR